MTLFKLAAYAWFISLLLLQGCASVPMASEQADRARKVFSPPTEGAVGLYIYRNSVIGQSIKQSVYLNGKEIGQTANKVYIYVEVAPGQHVLSTESEFGNNDLKISTLSGRLYFIEQVMKMGLFSGSSTLLQVGESEGQRAVRQCALALGNKPSTQMQQGKADSQSSERDIEPSPATPPARTYSREEPRVEEDDDNSKSVACDPRHRHLFFDCE